MPYADNDGVRIHYRVVGAGKPLVLHHGFTESIEDWSECGYVDALGSQHRLILIDARGHGRSDKPHDPRAYALENRVRDVIAVLDEVGIEKVHFWGYSMGGWIAFGMAQFAPDRIDRLVIGGQHSFARSMEDLRQMVRAGSKEVPRRSLPPSDRYSGQRRGIRRSPASCRLASVYGAAPGPTWP